jgi:hypothetical protein
VGSINHDHDNTYLQKPEREALEMYRLQEDAINVEVNIIVNLSRQSLTPLLPAVLRLSCLTFTNLDG